MAEDTVRIGLTGASGFIGTHITRKLLALPKIHFSTLRHKNNRVVFDPKELENFVKSKDAIIHLAGVNRGTDEEIIQGNVMGTMSLVEAAKKYAEPTTKLVLASSSQVYKPKQGNIKESQTIEPCSRYGVSKMAGEYLVRLSGLPYTILRLSNVYGPGCLPDYNSVISTFCDRATRNLTLTVNGDGNQGRDFIFIEDAVEAFLRASVANTVNTKEVFNISSGKITSLKQIIDKIKKDFPKAKVSCKPDENTGHPSFSCDNTRAANKLGWKSKVPMAKGIKNTLQWFQEGLKHERN